MVHSLLIGLQIDSESGKASALKRSQEIELCPGLAHPPSLSDGLTLLSSVSVIVSVTPGNQSSTNTKNKANNNKKQATMNSKTNEFPLKVL